MSDERNDGSVPPPAAPAAPPPLADAPPPVAPPQPYPIPGYPPTAVGSKTGMWVLFIILAFAAGVGATILTLWLTGDLWNSRSGSYPPSSYSSGSGTSSFGSTPSTSGGSTSSSTSGVYPPTEMNIAGTWGERCPNSTAGAITFYADHSVVGNNERGSWSLSGNYLTATTDRETTSLYWEQISDTRARVRRSGSSSTRHINRCP